MNIAVAFLPRHVFFDELTTMAVDALRHLGCQATPVTDGDPAALESDLLLLAGNCLGFERFGALFSTWPGPRRRPRIALWLTEALPPPGPTRKPLDQGLRIAGWIRTVKLSPAAPLLRIVPDRWRGPVYAALYRLLARDMTAHLQERSLALDAALRHGMTHRHLWLTHHWPRQWLDHLFVTTTPKHEFLRGAGFPAELLPFGYHGALGHNLSRPRDIEVLFLGGLYARRRKMLDTLRRALTAQGITVTVVGDACYGERRTDLLNRTRISLNLLSFPWELPGLRFLMSMGCGALVVSEPLLAPAPYLPGVHFVQAPAPELPAVITRYLEREDERAAIARSAEHFVTTELTLEKQLAQLLRAVFAGWRPPGQ